LFRVQDGLIVEHWDVIQAIPPAKEFANDNGKF
jgi:predicted SnoaL-like aldol condensation-catalyzing enzyme